MRIEIDISGKEEKKLEILKEAVFPDLSTEQAAALLLKNTIRSYFPITQEEMDEAIKKMPSFVLDEPQSATEEGKQ